MRYENENDYRKYVKELGGSLTQGTWKEYMETHDLPIVYHHHNIDAFTEYRRLNDKRKEELFLSEPYYCEVDIDSIKGFYRAGDGFAQATPKIRHKNYRVIDSIDYILKNECLPISVIKFNDGYYIQNGRHRFFAHLVLDKKTVPVWVCEITLEEHASDNMITIEKPLSPDLTMPEDVLEFYENYSMLFKSIKSVEMEILGNRNRLLFILSDGDTISFNGCCTSGNHFRSSHITCELLKKCGYLVDMNYISSHKTFCLEDCNDAHNMNFNSKLNTKIVNETIIPALDDKKKHELGDYDKSIDDNLMILYGYIVRYYNGEKQSREGEARGSLLLLPDTLRLPRLLNVGKKYFYFVGLNFREYKNEKEEERIYIFEDNAFPFNNLSVKFVGIIDESHSFFR